MPIEKRPGPIPRREPRYGFGVMLRDQHGFVGAVDAMYADYWSALDGSIVSPGWFEAQTKRPSTRDQIFYSLVGPGTTGAVMVGENEVQPAGGTA